MATKTKYIWDDDNLLAEADATNTINTVYTNEPQQFGNLVSSRISGTTSYHEFDALGSTRRLTNATGSTTDSALYDAWGVEVTRAGTTQCNLLWAGERGYYFDLELGQYTVRRRPFEPSIARWLTMDLLRFVFSDRANPFWYAGNSPALETDPSGMLCGAPEPEPGPPRCHPDVLDVPSGVQPRVGCRYYNPDQKSPIVGATALSDISLRPATGGSGGRDRRRPSLKLQKPWLLVA